MCMFTALEKLDLNGKNIIPFCANEGSGMGSNERDKKISAKAQMSKRDFQFTAQRAGTPKTNRLKKVL